MKKSQVKKSQVKKSQVKSNVNRKKSYVKKRRRKIKLSRVVILLMIPVIIIFGIVMLIKLISGAFNTETPPLEPTKPKVSEVTPTTDYDVVLDPGHGGIDTGCEYGTYYERDVCLNISNAAKDYLEKQGVRVKMTRENENALGDTILADLENRVQVAMSTDALLFVSIHINNADVEAAKGYEIYMQTNQAAFLYAQSIQSNLNSLNALDDRGIKTTEDYPLYVLDQNEKSSLLLEMGFMTNPHDRQYILDSDYQKKLGTAIGKGIYETLKQDQAFTSRK